MLAQLWITGKQWSNNWQGKTQ